MRRLAVKLAWKFINTPYRWKDADNSGFVKILLSGMALISKKTELTAHTLAFSFPLVQTPKAGCLAFWLSPNGQIYERVEFCLDDELSIGAFDNYINVHPTRSPHRIVDPFKLKPYHWEN